MNKNIGKIDKAIRIVLGLVILLAGVFYESWFALIGLVPIITATIGWCPLYVPFNISTCSKEECNIN